MMIKLLSLILFPAIFLMQALGGEERQLTLAELVSTALENNPQTRIAWSNAKRAAAAVGLAESSYYPQLSLDSYAAHGRQFKFVNGPDVSYSKVGGNLTLAMMLFDFGRTRASVQEAKYALLAANWQTDWVLQKVMVKVLENAYSTLHAQEALHAHEETLKDAQGMLGVSQELNRSGLRAITDVYTGRATLAQVQMEVAQQKALLDIQKGKLAASLGLPADAPIGVAPIGSIDVKVELVSALIAFAKVQRADLMAQQARLAEAWERVKRAKAEYYPKVSFRAHGGGDHYFKDNANPGHYDLLLNVDVPLFNGFETVYKNRYAYAEAEATEEELAQMELDISLEVLSHARSLEAAQEMMPYAAQNMESSLQAYQGVIEKYKAGKEGIAEVSNALRQLATARIRYSDIQTRYLLSVANLAYAVGILTPHMENSPCN